MQNSKNGLPTNEDKPLEHLLLFSSFGVILKNLLLKTVVNQTLEQTLMFSPASGKQLSNFQWMFYCALLLTVACGAAELSNFSGKTGLALYF